MCTPPRTAYFNVVYWPTKESDSTTPESTSPPTYPPTLPGPPNNPKVLSNAAPSLHGRNVLKIRAANLLNRLPKPPSGCLLKEHNKPCDNLTLHSQSTSKVLKRISKKTSKERARGEALLKDGIGQKAHVPCAHCVKNPDGCRVPTSDHVKGYNSLKCAKCISQKLKCCFNIDNPGIDYPPEILAEIRQNEKTKLAARTKAMATKTIKQEVRLGERPKSETPTPVYVAPKKLETLDDLVAASTWQEPPAKGIIGKPPPKNWQAKLVQKKKKRRNGRK
ncbi:hypothetical protein F4805DRAFT_456512 [Annulohypoxylon moriforme]|nr:hypothetical protein F4805DRAFT_456512 [Annulohypoxylon moriforme]